MTTEATASSTSSIKRPFGVSSVSSTSSTSYTNLQNKNRRVDVDVEALSSSSTSEVSKLNLALQLSNNNLLETQVMHCVIGLKRLRKPILINKKQLRTVLDDHEVLMEENDKLETRIKQLKKEQQQKSILWHSRNNDLHERLLIQDHPHSGSEELIHFKNELSNLKENLWSLKKNTNDMIEYVNHWSYEMKNQFFIQHEKYQQLLLENEKHTQLEMIEVMQENSHLSAKIKEIQSERKSLHNALQDLRGNVRVFCRLRPLEDHKCSSAVSLDMEEPKVNVYDQHTRRSTSFVLDEVFSMDSSQVNIFEKVHPLIISALDGYNVCILAYGQTGSGKTYTMLGDLEDENRCGLSFRVLQQLFDRVEEEKNDFENPQEAMKCILSAMKKRATGATDCNMDSSRSHCIVTITIQRQELGSDLSTFSKIHLVDLAGSERLSKSKATGERMKETQHINKSLSSLRHVLLSLKKKNSYIPYRDSKLTFFLQDALGKKAKTVMIVCINPSMKCAKESCCSLVFGECTTHVELGKSEKQCLK